jgi:hypothetical protein
MIETVLMIGETPTDFPLQDPQIREQLVAAGFDLTKPITWADAPETNRRRFTQGHGR